MLQTHNVAVAEVVPVAVEVVVPVPSVVAAPIHTSSGEETPRSPKHSSQFIFL